MSRGAPLAGERASMGWGREDRDAKTPERSSCLTQPPVLPVTVYATEGSGET